MTIKEHGIGCWMISLDGSQEHSHLVDVSYFGGSGSCSCPHFCFRIDPKLKRGEIKPWEAGSRCKHLLALRDHLGDRVMRNLSERTNTGPQYI